MSGPIRILHIVTHMERGGLETMIMNYYRAIDRDRIQFDFLVHRSAEAAYDREIQSLGGTIHRLPPLNPFSRAYLHALDTFFSEHEQYRIVHCHLDCMSAIPLKYAKKHGIPVRIAHSHNSDQPKDLKLPLKLYYKRHIRRYATQLFACGEKAGRWMFRTDDFRILNNAIDAERYVYDEKTRQRSRAQLGIPSDALVIGHVGRFFSQKNHQFLLKVFAEVVKTNTEAILLLVGDGELRPTIESQAEKLEILDRVRFLGVRPDVPDLLQAMDVFLFPSLFEGLGIAALEAQAAGLPCVASDAVPAECAVTELMCRLPLSCSAGRWADAIAERIGYPRRDTYALIRDSGFDIQENSVWLEDFYSSKWKAV